MANEFNLANAVINITGKVAPGLNAALGAAESATKKSLGNILALGQKIGTGMTIAGGAIVMALGAAVLGVAEYADTLDEMSQRTGFSTDSLQELAFAADQTGTSIEGIEKAVKKFSRVLFQAAEESELDAEQLAKAQERAAERVESAIERVADAQESVSRQQRDYGRSVMDAMENVAEARADESRSFTDYSRKVRDGYTNLSDAARKGRTGNTQYRDSLTDLQRTMADGPSRSNAVSDAQKRLNRLIEDGGPTTKNLSRAQRDLAKAQQELKVAMDPVGEAIKGMRRALGMLGLDYDKLKQMKPDEAFMLTAKRLSEVTNQSDRAGLALKLFGRSGTDILPMLADGAAGFDKLRQRAHELGLVMSPEMIKRNAAVNDSLAALKGQLKMAAYEIGSALIPALSQLVNYMTPILIQFIEWVRTNPELVSSIVKITVELGGFMVVMGPILIALPGLISLVHGLGIAFTALWGPIGAAIAVGGAGYMLGTWINNMVDKSFPKLAKGIDWIYDKFVSLINKIKEFLGLQASADHSAEDARLQSYSGGAAGGGTLNSGASLRSVGSSRAGFAGSINLTINTSGPVTPALATQIAREIRRQTVRYAH